MSDEFASTSSISRITSVNFLKNIYSYVHIFQIRLFEPKSWKSFYIFQFNNFFEIQWKITQNLQMQNKIKNYFQVQNIIKKKNLRTKHHPQTSSFPVKHFQTRFVSFLRETDLYTQRYPEISCIKKKKKRKISSEKEHDPVTETFPRPTFSSARRKLRALSSFLDSSKWIFKVSSSPVDACFGNRLRYGHALRRWNRWNKERY